MIEKLAHTYRNPGYVEKDGVFNAEWKEVTLEFPYTVLIDKINEIIDFLNNSQQEEKKEDYSYLDNLEQISHCCKAKLFFKGAGKGLWCSSCKKEVFHTEYIEEPKDQPSKPSIREEKSLKYRISYLLWNDNNLTRIKTDEYADQILSLITNAIMEEVEKHAKLAKTLGDTDYVKSVTLDEIQKLINNIKK